MSGGWVSEVFRSIQGEGLYAGVMQVFVRLSGCSLGCIYCDTPDGRERSPECRVEIPGGEIVLENPAEAEGIALFARALASGPPVHSISMTGGEPLEQPDFLVEILERLEGCGRPVYLETNGLETAAARRAEPLVDIVSLDIKLPSLCGGKDTFGPAARALSIFRRSRLFCKVVVAKGTEPDEVDDAARLIAREDREIPLVIQPATPSGDCLPPEPRALLEHWETASSRLDEVRVIPQIHRILGLR